MSVQRKTVKGKAGCPLIPPAGRKGTYSPASIPQTNKHIQMIPDDFRSFTCSCNEKGSQANKMLINRIKTYCFHVVTQQCLTAQSTSDPTSASTLSILFLLILHCSPMQNVLLKKSSAPLDFDTRTYRIN